MIERPIDQLKKDRKHLEQEIEVIRHDIQKYREQIDFKKNRTELMKDRLQEYDEAIYFLERLEESKEGGHE